jgi:hypothetical protein
MGTVMASTTKSKSKKEFSFSEKSLRDWVVSKAFFLEAVPLSKLCIGLGDINGMPKTNKIIVEVNKNKLVAGTGIAFVPKVIILVGRDTVRTAKNNGATHITCWVGEEVVKANFLHDKKQKLSVVQTNIAIVPKKELVLQREYMQNAVEALRMYVEAVRTDSWKQKFYNHLMDVPSEDQHAAAEAKIVIKESCYPNVVVMDFLLWQLLELTRAQTRKFIGGKEYTRHRFAIVGDVKDPSTWFAPIEVKELPYLLAVKVTAAII